MINLSAFGIVGLGKIGGNLALQALEKGFPVVGFDKKPANDDLAAAGLTVAQNLAQFREHLQPPRVILLYVPAGPAVDLVLDELAESLEPGDIIVDGGNSYWGDSMRRAARLSEAGLRFVDCGTSGGLRGARRGACFMAGGDPETVTAVEPLLRRLAVDGGFAYAGPSGCGHYAKLVHNGIEFGMLQAIGEGIDLLERRLSHDHVSALLNAWGHGSVIRSWLIELMAKGYIDPGLSDIPGYVEDTGEVNWLIEDAMRMEAPIPVIAQAVMQLFVSRDDAKTWAKAVATMRHGFGGHPFGAHAGLKRMRPRSRIGPFRGDEDAGRSRENASAASADKHGIDGGA